MFGATPRSNLRGGQRGGQMAYAERRAARRRFGQRSDGRSAKDELSLNGLGDDSIALADLGVDDDRLTAGMHQR